MRYIGFKIENYRAIVEPISLDLNNNSLIPLVGINECGKTTILQAIYCFDFYNDDEYKGAHLKTTENLYRTEDKDPVITAFIEIRYSDFDEIINEYNKAQSKTIVNKITKTSLYTRICISRNLTTKKYSIEGFEDQDAEDINNIAKNIIRHLPYILYNDDFNDRPPEYVKIPIPKPDKLTGWLSIYEHLFFETDNKYSIYELIKTLDGRRRDSILSDVKCKLERTLAKAWRTFQLSQQGKISIQIKIEDVLEGTTSVKALVVKIVEKIGQKERHFHIVDRSKGFVWFYNFVMKVEFNPKIAGMRKETIYLLDEPGSYLHATAQENLCAKIKEISEKYGKVIYCTHSHHLLNPESIPLNCVNIVEKDPSKCIHITPLPRYKTKSEKTSPLQPILEALQIPAFEFISNDKNVVIVEGIYDKYAINLFCNLDNKYVIFPSVDADSIIKNIQLLNAYSKSYVAIWDNDDEGRKSYAKAVQKYGEIERKRFDLLPLLGIRNRRMEDMFEDSDYRMIKDELKLPADATYETMLAILFYKPKGLRVKVANKLSDKSKERFKILKGIIEKRFSEFETIIKQREEE